MEKSLNEYQISTKRNALLFRTTSFTATEGSALHSGIYNRELTSSLAAGAVLVGIVAAMIAKGMWIGMYHALGALALFALLFFLFRVYVFYESYLTVTLDKGRGRLIIFIKGFISKRIDCPFEDVKDLNKGMTLIAPENDDGINVVKAIALQHNMVIPGFGERKTFHTVNFIFKDDSSLLVYSTQNEKEAELVIEQFRNFLGGRFIAQAH